MTGLSHDDHIDRLLSQYFFRDLSWLKDRKLKTYEIQLIWTFHISWILRINLTLRCLITIFRTNTFAFIQIYWLSFTCQKNKISNAGMFGRMFFGKPENFSCFTVQKFFKFFHRKSDERRKMNKKFPIHRAIVNNYRGTWSFRQFSSFQRVGWILEFLRKPRSFICLGSHSNCQFLI